jgi:ubiquinone/menaquinone biosynthesis C-methylase UbiE
VSASQNVSEYVLGNSHQEQNRLKLQASIIGRWTEKYLLAAGLEPGMRVLDVGTGMGDVAFLAANIVGPSGTVTGIDRDPKVIQKATERAKDQRDAAAVTFSEADIMSFHTESPFDAVIGRYVLLYQPDPPEAIRHLSSLTRQGGILCFHEIAFGTPIAGYPTTSLFSQYLALIGEVFRRLKVNPDMGLMLAKVFADAGLPRPILEADVPLAGEAGSYIYGWAAETVRSLLPRIEQLGLAKAGDLNVENLAQRIEKEAIAANGQILGPLQFGAWIRTPQHCSPHQSLT